MTAPAELIQWQGHQLCGRIQREAAGDIITTIGTNRQDLSGLRGQPFVCSHCHARRPKKAVWVFLREADGHLLTLGDACANEYFGADVQSLLEDALALYRGTEDSEDWGYGGPHRPDSTRATLLATFAASLIAFEGYRSRAKFEEECTSAQATALAYWVIDKGFRQVDARLQDEWDAFTRAWWAATGPRWEDFGQIVQDARVWWQDQAVPAGDYLANCKTAMIGMNPRHAGFISCGVWEFMKDQGLTHDPRKPATFADGWLGAPKDKLKDLVVELVDIKVFEGGEYGPSYFVSFKDAAGHFLLWKTSSNPNSSGAWKPGTRLTLSATIKEHGQWQALKQTILLRCKLAPVDAAA